MSSGSISWLAPFQSPANIFYGHFSAPSNRLVTVQTSLRKSRITSSSPPIDLVQLFITYSRWFRKNTSGSFIFIYRDTVYYIRPHVKKTRYKIVTYFDEIMRLLKNRAAQSTVNSLAIMLTHVVIVWDIYEQIYMNQNLFTQWTPIEQICHFSAKLRLKCFFPTKVRKGHWKTDQKWYIINGRKHR